MTWQDGDADDGKCRCDEQARALGGDELVAAEREQGRHDDRKRAER